ncbi:MAG: response regulator transcription factor [Burkholderiales bacterium]|nr:response regulator transcription factor [Burkholderiales bacterium]
MRLLLVEDDPVLGQAVAAHLESAGHSVQWALDLAAARQALDAGVALAGSNGGPELVLLDLGLPDGDGLDLLGPDRPAPARAVMVLTARDQVRDRIRGLQAGADDYLLKPFDLDELLARIEAVARRSRRLPVPEALHLDSVQRSVRLHGQAVSLTRMEWALLEVLAGHRGRLYTRNEIEHRLATEGLADGQSNSLEVIVSRLRKKLGSDAIVTHRGLGYSLA